MGAGAGVGAAAGGVAAGNGAGAGGWTLRKLADADWGAGRARVSPLSRPAEGAEDVGRGAGGAGVMGLKARGAGAADCIAEGGLEDDGADEAETGLVACSRSIDMLEERRSGTGTGGTVGHLGLCAAGLGSTRARSAAALGGRG